MFFFDSRTTHKVEKTNKHNAQCTFVTNNLETQYTSLNGISFWNFRDLCMTRHASSVIVSENIYKRRQQQCIRCGLGIRLRGWTDIQYSYCTVGLQSLRLYSCTQYIRPSLINYVMIHLIEPATIQVSGRRGSRQLFWPSAILCTLWLSFRPALRDVREWLGPVSAAIRHQNDRYRDSLHDKRSMYRTRTHVYICNGTVTHTIVSATYNNVDHLMCHTASPTGTKCTQIRFPCTVVDTFYDFSYVRLMLVIDECVPCVNITLIWMLHGTVFISLVLQGNWNINWTYSFNTTTL